MENEPGRHRFRKQERITSQKLVDQLFAGNSSHHVAAFPVRAVFATRQRPAGDEPVQVLVSVPKKRLRHAVDRNRAKRQVREAYRLNRHLLTTHVDDGLSVLVAFVWVADSRQPSAIVARQVRHLLTRIAKKL